MQVLVDKYAELRALAGERQARLEDNKRLWQYFWDMAELEQGFKELEQVLSSPDVGHDVQSVQLLLSKHKTVEDQMDSLERQMNGLIDQGRQLVSDVSAF